MSRGAGCPAVVASLACGFFLKKLNMKQKPSVKAPSGPARTLTRAARVQDPSKRPAPSSRRVVATGGVGEVRIIGGQWKRTKLAVIDKPGLRPTPDRVRETLFNWLGGDLSGWRCADVFAGTGALGFECASRGAASVLVIEQDPQLVERLEAVKSKLGAHAVQVRRGDGLSLLSREGTGSLDLVLLDPPFEGEMLKPAVAAAAKVCKVGGYVYAEGSGALTVADCEALGLLLHRHLKAGAVHAHLLLKPATAALATAPVQS
jgi:16S rRNA (guanine966-N2)-methyltransferase